MSRSMPAVVRLRARSPVERAPAGRGPAGRAPAGRAPAERRAPVVRRTLRLLAAGGVLLAAIVLLVALIAGGSAGQTPPASRAAAVIPGDALAYVHVSTDPARRIDRQALRLAQRFPDYSLASAAVLTRLGAILGGSAPADFGTQIRPWLGKEAALTMLNTATSTAESLIVLDVRDRARAGSFLRQAGASDAGSYGGRRLYRYPTGVEAAFVSHFLAVGQDAGVRAAIDTASGRAPSLLHDQAYEQASAGEPAARVLDLYASQAGVQRLVVAQGGIVGALGRLLAQPALAGVTISVAPMGGGIKVQVHSALVASLAALSGARPRAFDPSLPSAIPSGSMLTLESGALDKTAPRVLAAAAAAGIGGQIGPLLSRLGAALAAQGAGVQDILSIFHGESAVAIARAPSRTPSLVVLAPTKDPQRAGAALAALETPLAQLFAPAGSGAGQAPVMVDRQVGATTVHQLSLAPGLQFNYAVSHGLVVISTSVDGIAAVLARGRGLPSDAAYRAVLGSRPKDLTSLVFLDFSQLLSLGEQTGLARSARYRLLREDLQKIRAIGLHSTSGKTYSTAELFLQIS